MKDGRIWEDRALLWACIAAAAFLILLTGMAALLIITDSYEGTEDRAWSGIVVHHSATETGDVEAFRRYHVQVHGWDDVGYNFVILRDGTVQTGRSANKIGAHARGRNSSHLGVCLVGEDRFTWDQKESLDRLIQDLQFQYPIRSIERHHEKCPGPGIEKELFNPPRKKKQSPWRTLYSFKN